MHPIFTYTAEACRELVVFGSVFLVTYLLYRRPGVSGSGRHKLPPAMRSLPVVGSLPFLPSNLEDLVAFCISPRNKLGKIFSFRAGSKNMFILNGKKIIQEALVNKSLVFADRPESYAESLVNKHANGIIFARYNSAFKTHHQLCLSILKRFGFGQRVMETRILMEVEEMIGKVREKQSRPFDMKHLTTSCVANVIMSMLFGRRFDHSDLAFQQLISNQNELTSLAAGSMAIEIFPFLHFVPYFKRKSAEAIKYAKRTFNFINENIASCLQDENKVESFVSCFVEAHGPEYDPEQLLFTLRDLMSAGMETTAMYIRWAIVILTNHVSVQEHLQAEVDAVVGRQRLPTLDDRSRLPYVEATILELFRYKTVVPFTVPHCTLRDSEVGGYLIPRGSSVILNLHSVHMNPDDWQQPQLFRPERFLDESGNVIGRDRVIPFSLGKRSCLGEQLARQEIFLFLVSMLQNFCFKPPEGQTYIDVHEVWGVMNEPSDYEVRMTAR